MKTWPSISAISHEDKPELLYVFAQSKLPHSECVLPLSIHGGMSRSK